MTYDETRARAVTIVMQMFGTAEREQEWAHENAEAVVADLEAAGLLISPAQADDEAAVERAIFAGWHEFRYPRPAIDEPTDSFRRGVRAALAALREGQR